MKIEQWFSVPVACYNFTGIVLDSIQQEIQKAVSVIDQKRLTTPWGDSTLSTFSHTNNINDIKTYNMTVLENEIHNLVNQWCSSMGYRGSGFLIEESWLNFSNTDGFQFDHKHPGYRISGCYYYQTTGEDGHIRFENPNPYATSGMFPYDQINADGIVYKPAVGRLLLFPSWLTHRVTSNYTDGQRISLAFNLR